jgi:hypothetical protein
MESHFFFKETRAKTEENRKRVTGNSGKELQNPSGAKKQRFWGPQRKVSRKPKEQKTRKSEHSGKVMKFLWRISKSKQKRNNNISLKWYRTGL